VNRYGPPGLVGAAKKIFGRFDAALNVAALHLSKIQPDGPPKRRIGAVDARGARPEAIEAAPPA
jgi:hypothetical protein